MAFNQETLYDQEIIERLKQQETIIADQLRKPGTGRLTFRPAMYRGDLIPDYLCASDGSIWSLKTGVRTMMTPQYPRSKKSRPYPHVKMNGKNRKIHIIACHTWHNLPDKPAEISQEDWDKTPESVKTHLSGYDFWQVHHIDHDYRNFNPKNLMFCTPKENRDFAFDHYDGDFGSKYKQICLKSS